MNHPQVTVENGVITLRMYAETTAQIAKLLEEAIFHLGFRTVNESAQCQMLATMFRLATIAGVAQWNMDPKDTRQLNEALADLGLLEPEKQNQE